MLPCAAHPFMGTVNQGACSACGYLQTLLLVQSIAKDIAVGC